MIDQKYLNLASCSAIVITAVDIARETLLELLVTYLSPGNATAISKLTALFILIGAIFVARRLFSMYWR